jgi:hypothetical protein
VGDDVFGGGWPNSSSPRPNDRRDRGGTASHQRLFLAARVDPRQRRDTAEGSLGPAADFLGDPNLFEAQLPSGPFARVRLQQPGPTQTFGPRLSLEARSGTPLPKSRFDQALIGPIVDINPHVPPEGTVTHEAAAGDTRTRLEFWKASEQLRQVTFSRARDAAK